jgi:hypothetical protein
MYKMFIKLNKKQIKMFIVIYKNKSKMFIIIYKNTYFFVNLLIETKCPNKAIGAITAGKKLIGKFTIVLFFSLNFKFK